MRLYQDRREIASQTVKADGNGEWKYTFDGLDEAAPSGKRYIYTIGEDEVKGYETVINGYDITNTYTPVTPIITPNVTPGEATTTPVVTPGESTVTPTGEPGDHEAQLFIYGEVFWVDDDNKEGLRPDSVTLNLYSDGIVIQKVEVREGIEGKWIYEMDPVQRYRPAGNEKSEMRGKASGMAEKADSGKEIAYSLRQEDVKGYKWTASLNSVELDNHDVVATADFTDTLNLSGPTPVPGRVPIPTSTPSSGRTTTYSGGSNTTGGNTVNVGSTPNTVSTSSSTSADPTGTGARNRSTVSDSSTVSSVKTGDESNSLLMLLLMGASLLLILCVRKRRVR